VLHAGSLMREHGTWTAIYGSRPAAFAISASTAKKLICRRAGGHRRLGAPARAPRSTVAQDRRAAACETLPGRYEAFYGGIAESIRNGAPQLVTAEEARRGVWILEAAIQSAAEQRTVALR
jgi:scyllo-inositol 2-dehydrogenase (NADP+)